MYTIRSLSLQLLYSLLLCTQETLVWGSNNVQPGGAMSNHASRNELYKKSPVGRIMFAVILVILALIFVPRLMRAQATEQGRPDPTGQGRYLQFGGEVAYPQARVASGLPQGASECMHPGELVGVQMFNSTREGRAVSVKLTDKATIAVAGDWVFLCKCAGGFNQLFRMGGTVSSASATAGSSSTLTTSRAPTASNAALEAANTRLAALEAELAKLRRQQSPPQQMVVDGNPAMRNIAVFEAFPDCVLRLSASGKLSPEQASKDCRDTYRIERNGATNASRAQGSMLHGGGSGSGFGYGVTSSGVGGNNVVWGNSGRVW